MILVLWKHEQRTSFHFLCPWRVSFIRVCHFHRRALLPRWLNLFLNDFCKVPLNNGTFLCLFDTFCFVGQHQYRTHRTAMHPLCQLPIWLLHSGIRFQVAGLKKALWALLTSKIRSVSTIIFCLPRWLDAKTEQNHVSRDHRCWLTFSDDG